MESHGIFAKDRPFGKTESNSIFDGGRDNSRGQPHRRGGGHRSRERGDRSRGRGRGRGRGRERGGRDRDWQGRDRQGGMSEEDEDGDVVMEGKRWSEKGGLSRKSPSYGRGSIFSRLGNRDGEDERAGEGGGVFNRLSWGSSKGGQWHKVTIPRGGNHNRSFLLENLQSGIDAQLKPVQVHVLKDKLMFFIESSRAASQLKRLGRMDIRDDSLSIIVKPSPPPRMSSGRDGDQQMEDFDPARRGSGHGSRSSWSSRSRDQEGRGGVGGGGGGGGGRGRGRGGRFDPDVSMSQDTTSVLLSALGQRYDVNTKSLDLSSMYHDQILKDGGVKGIMYDKSFVVSILELIGSNCPELQALDLSCNRLQYLDAYSPLSSVCPKLQILNLSENEFRSPAELEKLSGMEGLTTLVVENNPFSQNNWDFIPFANSIRKLFPNLQTVDGQALPSPVKFDIPVSAGQLPSVQKGYVVNDQVQKLVVEFVKQYYSLYDGENREKLFEAYTDDAVFSLSVNTEHSRRGPSVDPYLSISRNLARLKDPTKRQSLVKHGRIDIVQCLRDLPPTYHHLNAFSVDVMRATPTSTAFTIYGFFSEVSGSRTESSPVKAFTRTFVLTAVGSGIAVSNDQMTLRSASQQQVKIAHEELAALHLPQPPQPTLQPPQPNLQPPQPNIQPPQPVVGGTPLMVHVPQTLSSTSLDPPTLQPTLPSFATAEMEAVEKISQHTRMNLDWSRKCLLENDWDFNKAVTAFTLLSGQGKIPAEAFQ